MAAADPGMSLQLGCIQSINTNVTMNNTAVEVTVTLTRLENPRLPTVRFWVPAGAQVTDVTAFINSLDTQFAPVNLAISLLGGIKQSAAELASMAKDPARASQVHSIFAELSAAGNWLDRAKYTMPSVPDPLNRHLTATTPSRVNSLVAADTAARRAEAQIKTLLDGLLADGVISGERRDSVAHAVALNRFKLTVVSHGFQRQWFV